MERRNSAKFLNARYWSCIVFFNVLVLLGFGIVLCKAFQLQVVEYPKWQERGRAQTETMLPVLSYRGSIYDRNGLLLSYSVPQRTLTADCDQLESAKKLASLLAPILEEPAEVLEKKLGRNRHYVIVKRYLTDQQALAVEALHARGLSLVNDYKRFYPCRQVAGQVLGFVGQDGTGLEGIEKAFDEYLKQRPKNIEQFRDGVRKCCWRQSSLPPEAGEGFGVRLTLDTFIQYISECELEKTVQQYRAKAGEIVVMDPRNFEILAMANWPAFDPNLIEQKKKEDMWQWRDRCIADAFEPGSVFKVILMSAAIQEGVVRPQDRIFCENGRGFIAGHTIRDTHAHGWLAIPEIIKYSSNIGASKIALELGGERYARYIHGFGFGQPTGVNLPGEAKGLVRKTRKWRPIDLATTGFGQSIGVTALQLTQAISCVANGGEFSTPLIARDILDSNGQVLRQANSGPPRRVVLKKTAQTIRDMMKLVCQEGGTGTQAVPEGYTVAGKTGTAQILEPGTKHYAAHKYTSVFTGFVPADKPRLVITVVIHEPQGAYYGGVVAGPAFRNIAAKALPYLGVMPSSNENGPSALPKGVRMAGSESPKAAHAAEKEKLPVSAADKEKSKRAAAEKEKSKQAAVEKEKSKSSALGREKSASRMPDVYGLPLKVALQKLSSLGIQAKVLGSGKVVGQYPLVGSLMTPETTVQLVLNEFH